MAGPVTGQSSSGEITSDLAMRRTGMSFQRTRMAADRTLMAVIRTSLSLITFGFTIYQIFEKLKDHGVLTGDRSARNFGTTLVLLGVGMLVVGIVYHCLFMLGLREERANLKRVGLIYGRSKFPPSLVLIVALLLLVVGVVAAISMLFHSGPYG